MKRCPPGVICVENITLFILACVLMVLGIFLYMNGRTNDVDVTINDTIVQPGFYNDSTYYPPLRDSTFVKTVPINVSTNIGAVTNIDYRQTGIITPLNGSSKDNILPLMGRPLFTNRDKWQYYTISNQHNSVKLPISFKGKSALNDYGVDQIFDGDTVYVEGYNEAFKATIYENNTLRYLPFL
jgi:hypothetical protein